MGFEGLQLARYVNLNSHSIDTAMAKLVEYPPPPSPERTLEERWCSDSYFHFEEFTDSELAVSGFHDLLFGDELEDESFERVYFEGSELQQLVIRAFGSRASGAFRMLWMEDSSWDDDLLETRLMRFPSKVAGEVLEIVGLVAEAREPMLEEFVQCVAMLHAYTGLPIGELSREDRTTRQHILSCGLAREAVARIMRGPWLTPRTADRRKSK